MVNSLRVDPSYPAPEVELRLYDRDTRTDVITALGLIGLDHDRGDAVSLLLEWVKYPPADTQESKSEIEQQFDRAHKASFRGVAIEALGRIGALEDPVIVEHVAKCLDDPEWSVGRAACEALAHIGAPDFDAWILSRLIAEFRMGDDAATAVRRMTAPSEVNRLISLLLIWSREVDPEIKKRAVRSLAKIGRPAAIGKVFRRLISLLDHYDEYVREEAAEVLGGLQGIADVRIASTLSKVEVLRLRFRYWRRRAK